MHKTAAKESTPGQSPPPAISAIPAWIVRTFQAAFVAAFLQPSIAGAQNPDILFAALEESITKVVARAEKSVVAVSRIRVGQPNRFVRETGRNPFGIQDPVQSSNPNGKNFFPKDFATGVVIAPQKGPHRRLVLTTYHAVKGGQATTDRIDLGAAGDFGPRIRNPKHTHNLFVRFNRHQSAAATIFAADPRSDLAVLAIHPMHFNAGEIPALALDVATEIKKGQFCISLTNPYAIARDGSPSVSLGMVSNIGRFPYAESRQEKSNSIHFYGTLLHVESRLGPGASGGALLNRKGQLIGITTSMTGVQGYESNVGFAIPYTLSTKRIIEELSQGYEVEYGFLGVRLGDARPWVRPYGDQQAKRMGIVAQVVVANSPAQRGGLRNNDIILSVGSKLLYDEDDLFREVGLLGPGATANLRVMRKGRELSLRVPLGKFPTVNGDDVVVARFRHTEWRGLRVDWPTSRQKYVDYEKPYPRSVVVTNVAKNSSAEQAGLREEDLIASVGDKAVQNPAEFAAAVRNLTGDVKLRLHDGREIVVHR